MYVPYSGFILKDRFPPLFAIFSNLYSSVLLLGCLNIFLEIFFLEGF